MPAFSHGYALRMSLFSGQAHSATTNSDTATTATTVTTTAVATAAAIQPTNPPTLSITVALPALRLFQIVTTYTAATCHLPH